MKLVKQLVDDLTDRLKELEKKTEDNNFWNNADES